MWLGFFAAALLSAAAREVTVTVLYTTDVHGHLCPGRDYEGRDNVGGLLRCAAVIEAQRTQNTNALLVDCGDFWIGSPESYFTRADVARKAMAWLRYDAWVIGNHDFDWGLAAFQRLLDRAPAPALAANVCSKPGAPNPAGAAHSYLLREVEGIRVALVGLTTPGMPSWFLPEYLGPLQFESSVSALRRVMPAIRESEAEIRILLLHQGVRPFGDDEANELERIAQAFPEFDLILGGHTHRLIPGFRLRDVWYSQAGYHGLAVGRADLTYDTVRRRVTQVRTELLPVGSDLEPPAGLMELVGPELRRIEEKCGREVARLTAELEASVKPPGQSPAQQLISAAVAKATGAEIVLHGILAEDRLPAGPVTWKDLWRLVPYENRLGLLSLTGRELRAVLEENANHAGTLHFQGVRGIAYDLDLAAPEGHRVRNLRLADGRKLHGRRRYRVAANSYVLASGGLRFPRLRALTAQPHARFELTPLNTRDVLREYLRCHPVIVPTEGAEVRLCAPTRPAPARKRVEPPDYP